MGYDSDDAVIEQIFGAWFFDKQCANFLGFKSINCSIKTEKKTMNKNLV